MLNVQLQDVMELATQQDFILIIEAYQDAQGKTR